MAHKILEKNKNSSSITSKDFECNLLTRNLNFGTNEVGHGVTSEGEQTWFGFD
jgi:hypothetical protein